MNREEQIRIGNPYSGSSAVGFGKMEGFNAGAQWADKNPVSPWVTVADKEPDEFKNVLLSEGSCPGVFVGHFNGEDFVVANTGQIVEYFRVLHWMSIPEEYE